MSQHLPAPCAYDGPIAMHEDDARIQPLNDLPPAVAGKHVLYWMQASQRVEFNHALEHAIASGNEQGLPALVCFGLTDDYPEANERHYAFMLEGLVDVATALRRRGVRFVALRGSPPEVALRMAKEAAMVVCDRGYLRHQKRWRDEVADRAGKRVVQVESDVIVPTDEVSDKQEYAARTIRPKIHRLLDHFLVEPKSEPVRRKPPRVAFNGGIDLTDADSALAKMKIDRSVARSRRLKGGAVAAHKLLRQFLETKLDDYDDVRNEPAMQGTSFMSAYLHFGQISPLEIALRVQSQSRAAKSSREAYLEELIVRRELAVNFVHQCAKYDAYDCLPAWARKTLAEHRRDKRPYVYTRDELEQARTHDEFWNAAQREMTATGFMHNYMRMYWGKKILEWKRTPQEAYADILHLNNKYFLCGRDPNAYANVGWIFGLHDRPWGPARPIFGTVRYMNAAGLQRKFDMNAYVRMVEGFV